MSSLDTEHTSMGASAGFEGPSINYLYEHLFPFPLADAHRRFRVARGQSDKVGHGLFGAEVALKFLVAIALGCPRKDANTQGGVADVIRQLRTPTLGIWVEIARKLGANLGSDGDFLVSSTKSCLTAHGPVSFLGAAGRLVAIRNRYIHVEAITESAAAAVLDEVVGLVSVMMSEIRFLAKCHLVICEEVQRRRLPACYDAVVRLCKGSNPLFPFENWRLASPIDPGVCYMLLPDVTTGVCLSPIVIVERVRGADTPYFAFINKAGPPPRWVAAGSTPHIEIAGSADASSEVTAIINGTYLPVRQNLSFYQNRHPVWVTATRPDTLWCLPHHSMIGIEARGRFSEIFQIFDERTKKVRALKVMRSDIADDPRIRTRFEREANALFHLSNLGVAVAIVDAGETELGLPYLLLDYVDSGSLLERLRRGGPLGWGEALDCAIVLLRKLTVIHSEGILHRDIKLSNLLGEGEEIVFCDFGSERPADDDSQLTLEGDAIGTLGYMAPEQKRGQADVRSDIYSVGVCLVNLLAGTELAEPRAFLRTTTESTTFRDCLLAMIEEIPENRPPSAGAVLDRLLAIKKRWGSESETDSSSESAVGLKPRKLEYPPLRSWKSPCAEIFRMVPPGSFLMGGTKYPDERPVHQVVISERFYVSATLVTNRLFKEFTRATGYSGRHRNSLLHLRDRNFSSYWQRPDCPVVFVSWEDANEYILWRCESEDRDYRLLTEAQWEYCTRAGTRTVYPWGNEYDPTRLNSDDTHGHPTNVGAYPSNQWGLHDMLGNVWEWCQDVKDVSPREESLFYRHCADMEGDCVDPVNSSPTAMRSNRVDRNSRAVRGGSFHSQGRNHRPANRRGQNQTDAVRSIGFRLARFGVLEAETEITPLPSRDHGS